MPNTYTPEQINDATKRMKYFINTTYCRRKDAIDIVIILSALEAAESSAAKLEKAGDAMREGIDEDQYPNEADAWDAARKEKP